jgi:hypothetical protein
MEGFMTLAQMAEALGLRDTAGLRRSIAAGRLRAELMGKTYIVKDAEVERYRRELLGKRGRPRKPEGGTE